MTDEKKDWKTEAEEALQKAGDSLTAAWDASRDGRVSALEAAKLAARQLGEAIDKGVAVAKETWATTEPEAATEEPPAETAAAPTEEE
jgi:hypothetical protein